MTATTECGWVNMWLALPEAVERGRRWIADVGDQELAETRK